jgi:membrane-associated phospholipid phosphatase
MFSMKYPFKLLLLLLFPLTIHGQNPDINILRHLNSPTTLPSDDLVKFISDSHYVIVLGTPISLGIAGLLSQDEAMCFTALETGVATALNVGLSQLIKNSVNRPRPFETYPDILKKADGGSPSFPSGHTAAAFATATSLSLNYPTWKVIVPSFVWAGAVGYSRMYLGVHYPSDVLAGALLGAGSAWLTFEINHWLQKKYTKNYGFHF